MTGSATTPLVGAEGVLDPRQLVRIEGVHRGFLYQHLYGVGCLLLAQKAGVRLIIAEKDEDIELLRDGARDYVQVKTRDRALQLNDIADTLDQFNELRALHSARSRDGTPRCIIVSNVEPGPGLDKKMSAKDWPTDVTLVWPGHHPSVLNDAGLPPAWSGVDEGLSWCVANAVVPLSRVVPETLVLKLAALFQLAGSGESIGHISQHEFHAHLLPDLFEQVARSVQELPAPPSQYWPHDLEPEFDSASLVTLVVGPSGAGKSAWAAANGLHSPSPVIYYAINAPGSTALAAGLAREVAARCCVADSEVIGQALAPGTTAHDSLRALAIALRAREIRPTVVLDDIQRVDAAAVVDILRTGPELRWVLLCHPGPVAAELEARLSLGGNVLRGWSPDTIGLVLRSSGAPTDIATCHRVRALTGGLPLFVENVAQLAEAQHAGDVAQLCDILESGTHARETAQEVLLTDTKNLLTVPAQKLAEILAVARIPLEVDEAVRTASVVGLSEKAAGSALRELGRWGVSQEPRPGRIQLHEAFRIVFDGLSQSTDQQLVRKQLCDLFEVRDHFEIDRSIRYLQLLPSAGLVDRFADIVGNESERMYETGLLTHVAPALQEIVDDATALPRVRFWSLDALAYFELQARQVSQAKQRLDQMIRLNAAHTIDDDSQAAIAAKEMQIAAMSGNVEVARRAQHDLLRLYRTDEQRRVVRYNFGAALFSAKLYDEAEVVAGQLIAEYYTALGIDPARDVFLASNTSLAAKLHESQADDAKRLADCLDLIARVRAGRGRPDPLSRIHAMKFYGISGAMQSVVKVGQDVVDDLLDMGNAHDARKIFEEQLLPTVEAYKMHEHAVAVRSQYAVVLAYSGDIPGARAEMKRLRPFMDTTPEGEVVRRNQEKLIESIATGEVRLPNATGVNEAAEQILAKHKRLQSKSGAPKSPPLRVGRNQLCPCGSGKKFKKCHGRTAT